MKIIPMNGTLKTQLILIFHYTKSFDIHLTTQSQTQHQGQKKKNSKAVLNQKNSQTQYPDKDLKTHFHRGER